MDCEWLRLFTLRLRKNDLNDATPFGNFGNEWAHISMGHI